MDYSLVHLIIMYTQVHARVHEIKSELEINKKNNVQDTHSVAREKYMT